MLIGMTSILGVLGVAAASNLSEYVLEHIGHGDKVIFIKIAGYCVCAFIAWDIWWKLVNHVSFVFGVGL